MCELDGTNTEEPAPAPATTANGCTDNLFNNGLVNFDAAGTDFFFDGEDTQVWNTDRTYEECAEKCHNYATTFNQGCWGFAVNGDDSSEHHLSTCKMYFSDPTGNGEKSAAKWEVYRMCELDTAAPAPVPTTVN